MAVDRKELQLIIKQIKSGSGIKDIEKDLKDLNKVQKKTAARAKLMKKGLKFAKASLIGLGVAALASIGPLVMQGLNIERTNTALVAYTGSAAMAAEVTDAVSAAAGGAISKFAATQNATKLFAMGLATTSDEAAQLTKAAITLGSTMGKGPTEAFDQFSLLLANQSIPRLDTFGISASQVRIRMADLADEFPELDRQARFTTATLDIANEKLAALDAEGFNAASSIDVLKARATDAKDAFATWLSEGIVPVLDKMIELREETKKNEKEMLSTQEGIDKVRESYANAPPHVRAYVEAQIQQAEQQKRINAATELGATVIDSWSGRINTATGYNRELMDSLGDVAITMDMVNTAIQGKLGNAIDSFDDKTKDLTHSNAELQAELDNLITKGLGPGSAQYDDLTGKIQNNNDALESESEKLKRVTAELLFQNLAIEGNAEANLNLARELGLVDERTFEVVMAAQRLKEQYEADAITLEEYIQLTGELQDNVDNLHGTDITVTTTFKTIGGLPNIPGGASVVVPYTPEAHGGEFEVRGTPGNDRVPLSFLATPGEKVTFTPRGEVSPGERAGSGAGHGGLVGGGGSSINIENVNITGPVDLAIFEQSLRRAIGN